jgi:hypothetical protein
LGDLYQVNNHLGVSMIGFARDLFNWQADPFSQLAESWQPGIQRLQVPKHYLILHIFI